MTVASPCIKLCILDAETRICTGCHRTLAEIGGWSSMTDVQRRAVLARIETVRQGAAAPRNE